MLCSSIVIEMSANGAGLLTYAYQWEACNVAGADCTPVQGATEPAYTPSESVAATRVQVTVTSPSGTASAHSASLQAGGRGEVSSSEAIESAQHADPALFAPATSATVEGQELAPALSDGGEDLSATGTLTSSTVSKEAPGEFAVNTPDGMISITPQNVSPAASTLPTVVNGAAAFFANTWRATDSIVRPNVLGTTTLLQLRSPQAPSSFSWEVQLGADQQLQTLSDGAIAIVDPTEAPTENNENESAEEEAGAESEEEAAEPAVSEGELESEVPKEEEPQEEVTLESPSAAPTVTTEPGEAAEGQPQPQQTRAQYEADQNALSSAEGQTGPNTLAVITPPTITDARPATRSPRP
jgi:hypothetical protein